jgi:hypothetical protein
VDTVPWGATYEYPINTSQREGESC